MKISLLILVLCVPIMAQEKPLITWGCAMRPPTDKVEDFITLDCVMKESGKAFVLDVPKTSWFKEWSLPGQREFYYGGGKEGSRYAVKTAPTHCDTEFDVSGSRNQDQMCGIMFPRDRELVVLK